MINKFINNKLYRICILTLLITILSGLEWSGFGNTTINWIIDFIFIYTLFQYKKQSHSLVLINIYLIWLFIGTIRGIFIAENYWEWKQLITGFLSLSIPLFIYPFQSCSNTQIVLSYWKKYAIPLFVVFFFFLPKGAYHFYLGPILLLTCLFPLLSKKWKIICGVLTLIMLVGDLGARSQVIKAAISILVAFGCYYKKYISNSILKIAHWSCYLLPLILLYLGFSGQFNIFENSSQNEKYTQQKVVNGQIVEENLSADTRSFIYREVITSALHHNYVLWGRTPARGNDSVAFGSYNAEELKTGKYERHANELCHTNVFTWLGLIGVILYSFIYLRSSFLAVYKSNNFYIKILGCFIAFRWAYGWIEDFNRFDIMNISLWMIIAMGLSSQFRQMNDYEFKLWVKTIFNKR